MRPTIRDVEKVLELLNDIALSDAIMGWDDVERLCEARLILAQAIGAKYWSVTERYTRSKKGCC